MVYVHISCTLHIKLSYAHITLRFSIHDDDPRYICLHIMFLGYRAIYSWTRESPGMLL